MTRKYSTDEMSCCYEENLLLFVSHRMNLIICHITYTHTVRTHLYDSVDTELVTRIKLLDYGAYVRSL